MCVQNGSCVCVCVLQSLNTLKGVYSIKRLDLKWSEVSFKFRSFFLEVRTMFVHSVTHDWSFNEKITDIFDILYMYVCMGMLQLCSAP